jgi:hypothetical protein
VEPGFVAGNVCEKTTHRFEVSDLAGKILLPVVWGIVTHASRIDQLIKVMVSDGSIKIGHKHAAGLRIGHKGSGFRVILFWAEGIGLKAGGNTIFSIV